MSWLLSLGVAIIAGIVGMFAAGFVADLSVGWYRISSSGGGSAFFVLGMALLGLIGGAVGGLIAARVVAAQPKPTFLKGLGAACLSVVAVIGAIGGVARFLADIPPEIDGEELFLLVELRWPEKPEPPPGEMPGPGFVRLGAAAGPTIRVQESGPLFTEDARQAEGRWVVPGAVSIFTSRGQRVLEIGFGDRTLGAFVVPLPGHPRDESRQWSEWLPRPRPGDPPLADQFSYRFRVLKASEPMRVERVGPFEIDTVVSGFYQVSGSERIAATSRFRVRHRGAAIPSLQDAKAVAVLSGEAALLVEASSADGERCYLVKEDGNAPVVEPGGLCSSPLGGRPVTSDAAQFARAKAMKPAIGWVDRHTFRVPGLFLVNDVLVDTRRPSMGSVSFPSDLPRAYSLPPLGVSPDERSLAWFAEPGFRESPVVGVTDRETGQSYTLAVDRGRMRFNRFEQLDPAWLLHHFAWTRGPDGRDVLAERPGFVPLPHRGDLTRNKPGEYQSYLLQPAGPALRDAVVALLVSELKCERLPDEPGGYDQHLRISGEVLDVSLLESSHGVVVSTNRGDPAVMGKVAEVLDAAMATGKYDELFAQALEAKSAQ